MTKATLTRTIPVDSATIWAALADFQGVHKFHPIVDTVDQLTAHDRGLGAGRRCNFYDGTSVVEKVTDIEDGRRVTVELSEFSMPLKSATASMVVTPRGVGSTDVTIEMDFIVKGGPLGAIMGAIMMRPMMKKMFGKVLAGLEHHVSTGEWVGRDGVPIASAA